MRQDKGTSRVRQKLPPRRLDNLLIDTVVRDVEEPRVDARGADLGRHGLPLRQLRRRQARQVDDGDFFVRAVARRCVEDVTEDGAVGCAQLEF